MCFGENKIKNLNKWNWDGDIIIHNPVVPSSRPVVGYSSGHVYDIDVREFLVTERNAIMHNTLRKDIVTFLEKDFKGDLNLFNSRKKMSFDYRAYVIISFVSNKISYLYRKEKDFWQFPDETLHEKVGDCDDRAILIASLLLSSGISSFNVRVALGKVRISSEACDAIEEFDHMWVMYKTEGGQWTLFEPLMTINPENKKIKEMNVPMPSNICGKQDASVTAEYIPYFLFNDTHLWGVLGAAESFNFQDEIKRRKIWSNFNPRFAGEIHRGIIHEALKDAPPAIQEQIESYFSRALLGIVGPYIDLFDRGKYNPVFHFDNCYINEGWELVKKNLTTYKNNNKDFKSFFMAAHGIADFYAHSSYPHFAEIIQCEKPGDDYLALFNSSHPFKSAPDYSDTSNFNLVGDRFSVNRNYWVSSRNKHDIAAEWAGKIISGRYAQTKDTWSGFEAFLVEGILSAIPRSLLKAPDFFKRGWVPHHNEMAIDSPNISQYHRLYSQDKKDRLDRMSYENQFHWRWNSSVNHIRKAFYENVDDLI